MRRDPASRSGWPRCSAPSDVAPAVRPAEPADLEQLPEIDSRAETLFRVAGMDLPEIPFPVDALHESKAVFVAGRPPVGFVQVDEVDGIAHVQELAVLPSHMRQGLGIGAARRRLRLGARGRATRRSR